MDPVTPSLVDTVLPPPAPREVYRIGGIGTTVCAAAGILGMIFDHAVGVGPDWQYTLRLLLVAGGLVTAGGAISMRAGLPIVWLIAAAAFFISIVGLPPHWDSAKLVAIVGGCVCIAAAGLAAAPWRVRSLVLSLLAVWHFGGILCATTWPEPTPWMTAQVGTRVYMPYLMFMYLRNAYHFYSPDPGPASLLFCLVGFEYDEPRPDPVTGKPTKGCLPEWVILPDRQAHTKDPLGLTYFRRLSITEQVSTAISYNASFHEAREVQQRRDKAAGEFGGYSNYPVIPKSPDETFPYRMPRPDVTRFLLPSYGAHLLWSNTRNGRTATSVKIYRLEHRVLPPAQFARDGFNPHHPTTFHPFFLGEFAANAETGKVELVDPQDPLLYWNVPILPKPITPGDKELRDYTDYMSIHAKYRFDWSARKP